MQLALDHRSRIRGDPRHEAAALGVVLLIVIVTAWLLNKLKPPPAYRFGLRRHPSERELARRFGAEVGLPTIVRGEHDVTFSGFAGLLRAEIQLQRSVRTNQLDVARVSIAAGDVPSMTIRREEARARLLNRVFDHEVGDPTFDARFLLDARTPAGQAALARGEVRRAIERVFALDNVTKLVLDGERVSAHLESADEVDPLVYRSLLDDLALVASRFQRAPVHVKVLGGAVRAALKGVRTAGRCAYCHEDITGAEPDLISCAGCGTLTHEACWGEDWRCAVFGCSGKPRAEERTR